MMPACLFRADQRRRRAGAAAFSRAAAAPVRHADGQMLSAPRRRDSAIAEAAMMRMSLLSMPVARPPSRRC